MKKHRSISVTALAGAAALSCLCVGPALSGVTRVTHTPPPESVCKHCTPPLAIQAPVPPSGFNPVTASDEELAFYGYPPRPDINTAPDAYNSWQRVMSLPVKRVKTTFQQTTLSNGPIQILSEGRKVPGTVATGTSSSNWSGYADVVASNPFKKANTTIYGVFVVPIAQQAFDDLARCVQIEAVIRAKLGGDGGKYAAPTDYRLAHFALPKSCRG